MLRLIAIVLIVLWLLGFIGHVAGGLVHALLVIALVIFIFDMLSGRNTTV